MAWFLKLAACRKCFVPFGPCASGNVSKMCLERGKEPLLGCCLLHSRLAARRPSQKRCVTLRCLRGEALLSPELAQAGVRVRQAGSDRPVRSLADACGDLPDRGLSCQPAVVPHDSGRAR